MSKSVMNVAYQSSQDHLLQVVGPVVRTAAWWIFSAISALG
jgi:hypothetical protein